jgi:hypothetical protein
MDWPAPRQKHYNTESDAAAIAARDSLRPYDSAATSIIAALRHLACAKSLQKLGIAFYPRHLLGTM